VAEKKNWVDIAGIILVPLLIAVIGGVYTRVQWKSDEERLHLDRDIGYLKLLASEKETEQQLGLVFVAQRKRDGDFSNDLHAMLTELAAGPPDLKTTQAAKQILDERRQVVESIKDRNDQTSTPVYIQ
jgi:hypothetical protein